jgi:hypothetical protein
MGVQKDQDSRTLTAEHYRRHGQQLAEKRTIKNASRHLQQEQHQRVQKTVER